MPRNEDRSLGHEGTFDGAGPQRAGDAPSLGDEMTLGGTSPSSGDTFDDGMEVVDLSARYKVEGTLGKGGMGEVLLATDTRLNRKVAIKRVLGDGAKSQTAVKRFLTEAQSIAALNHFNIVQIYDYGRDSDGPFLIMEHVDGGSLLDKCREGALPLEEAVELTCQLCDGLEMAHAAGIIHRDIKPANVLMTSRGEPKLTDFGLARQDTADTGQTMAGAVLGTLDFMPPEQRKDATTADHRSDLWSLAATLYQLVTGKSPKIIRFNDVPESLQDVLGKALEEAPGDRYQSAGEFRQALQASVQESSGGPARDLKTGECRSCGHANDPGRKFCQSCGGPLTEACLSCDQDNGVWETFCGGCGANQEQLADSKITELSEQRSRVDSLCREYRYDDALQLVGQLADQSHPRFAEFPVWAQETRPEIEREYAEAKAERERLIGEARSLMGQQEYGAVPRLFESLAKGLWNSDVQGLIMQAGQSEKEAAELLTNIKQLVRDRSYEGLLEKTERFLELRPDRKDIREVHATLSKRAGKRAEKQAVRDKVRSAEILDEVREKMRAKDFASVVMLLADLPEGYETEESMDLLRKAQVRVEQSEKLLKQIDKAVKKGQTSRLLPKLDDYLKLVSTDERIESLREKLAAQQRVLQRKVKAGIAGVCLLVMAVTVGMYLKSRADEKAQAIAAAVESQSWATVLTLDSGNTQALLGRAQNRLNADPPEFDGALANLQAAEAEDPQTEGLSALKATVYARRAGVQADADQIDKAEADLKAAQALELAPVELTAVREKLAAAHLRYAGQLADAGQLEQAIASRDQAATYGADAGALAPFNDRLAEGHLKQAESLTLTSAFDRALQAVAAAKLLNAALPRIASVEAAVYVQRARQSLNDSDRDAASADFLSARKLDPRVQGLGQLAAGLADGLVQRCEDTFTDAAFEEATAALATVTELEPNSESLPGLKDRLGKVLVSQGDAALADGSLPRVGAIIESLQTLGVLPDDQTRLADGLFTAAADVLNAALEKQDLPSVTEAVRLISGLNQVPQEQRDKAIADAVTPLSQMLLDGLKGDQPQEAATAVTDLLAAIPELATALQDGIEELPDEVKQLLPVELRRRVPPSWLKDSLVAYYPFNGNANDESGNGNDGTLTGGESIPDRHGRTNTAFRFRNKSYVTVPSSESLNMNRAFALSAWVKAKDTRHDNVEAVISGFASTRSAKGRGVGWELRVHALLGKKRYPLSFVASDRNSLQGELQSDNGAHQWMHVVACVDSDSSELSLYADGLLAARDDKARQFSSRTEFKQSQAEFGSFAIDAVFIGCSGGNSSYVVDCAIDDVRIYNRALSAAEVKALYDYEAQPPEPTTDPALTPNAPPSWINQGLVAYYPFNGNAKDESANGNDGKVQGTTPSSDRFSTPNRSYSFDGVDDGIVLPDVESLNVGPGSFTLSAWVLPRADKGIILEKMPLTGTTCINLLQNIGDKSKGETEFFVRGPRYEDNLRLNSPQPLKRNEWQLVTAVKSAATSRYSLYVDGQLRGAGNWNGNHHVRAAWHIGMRAADDANAYFKGSIDDVRIYNRALSAAEVKALYEYEAQPPGQPVGQAPPPAVAPFDATQAKAHQKAWADYLSVPVETTNSIGMKFVVIPPGEFMMGSPEDEPGREDDETLHKVTLTQPFQIGMHEVTQEQYEKVMGTNPSERKGPQNPVEMVSWNDAVEFCRKLSEQPEEKAAGSVYRLPTEAQWEYACRAGTTTQYGFGNNAAGLQAFAWFMDNSGQRSHPVGQEKPNPWGLYDMHGNVWEWCQDWYGDYPSGSPTDPTGAASGSERVARGGCFHNNSVTCRSAYRYRHSPDARGNHLGFRVLRVVTPQAPPPAIAPFNATQAKAHQQAWANHLGVPVETTNSIGMNFVVIPPGEFMMGSPEDEPGRRDDETPLHKVTLTQPFQMGMHEVTQEQYEKVMGNNPSEFKGAQNPVETVSWDDAVEFCRKLSALPAEKSSGYVYRLPTEAGWAYACRAGTKTAYSFGDSKSEQGGYSWFHINSGRTTHPVGGKKPNPWGLYDMHGNVWEWCQDWHGQYPNAALTDPTGPVKGSSRVIRGGSYHDLTSHIRSAFRNYDLPHNRNTNWGFRVVRVATQTPASAVAPSAVAPFDAAQAKAHQQAWADYLGVPVETTNSIGMKFAVIPPGEFMMGSPKDEPERVDHETLHRVTLTQPFQMGMHEVTQEQYQKAMGANPSKFKGPQNPVEQVSWNDAVEFCRKLSEQPEEKAAGYAYRLPTEAEWEYACRAGTTTRYSFGDSESELGDYAWHDKNSAKTTHPVGGKKPNPWGLYDMHGNVWEWCQDWYGNYPSDAATDPTGAASGSYRVSRGGRWDYSPQYCRSAVRNWNSPDHRDDYLGFRVLRSSIK